MNYIKIQNMEKKDQQLSQYATKNSEVIKFSPEKDDIRLPFFRDVDKIIYSLSYVRYVDKTQVFSNLDNDHISKRMIHVQLVSKIARTIGRALSLNEDLIEAGALGHDLGHVPFGHIGERILSRISENNHEGYFNHNIQSIRTLLYVENNGQGVNISLQVLDAIMCHNGEFLINTLCPVKKSKEEFFSEYERSYKDQKIIKQLRPMTLEGCVVRISDVVGYIGRDIEDACRLGVIKETDIPKNITSVLGSTNKSIVNTIVNDIVENSYNQPYIKMSDSIYNAIKSLKEFNNEYIYKRANTKDEINQYELMFNSLFDTYLNDLRINNKESSIYKVFLNNMIDDYQKSTSPARIVLDYIAGMTDEFFLNEYNRIK